MSFRKLYHVKNTPLVTLLTLISILIIFLPIQAEVSVCSLKEGAGDKVIVEYKTKRKGLETIKLVTKGKITWKPSKSLENTSCLNKTATQLQVRAVETSEWKTEVADKTSGDEIKWVIDVKPCFVFRFQNPVAILQTGT